MTRARDLAKLIAGSSTLGGTGELVLKDVDTADGSSPKITFQTGDTDIAADDVLGTIDFQAPDEGTGTDALLVAAGIEAVSEGDFSASNNATKLSFKTGASETATEKMIIKSDGNIGIGISPTTSYGNALQIHDTGTSGANLRLTDSNTGSGTGNGFEIIALNTENYLINREAGPIYTLINGDTVQKINADGHATFPKTSAFSAKVSSQINNLTAGGASNTVIVFDDEIFDQNADYNTNGTFTAPVTGKYVLMFHLRLETLDTTPNTYDFNIITGNRAYGHRFDPDLADYDANFYHVNLTVLADMDANDTCQIQYYQDGGGAQTDIDPASFFMGYLAC